MEDKSPLFRRAVTFIKAIPKGKVVTYGQIAELIAAPGCARHISYILSSSAKKYQLPWHRVIGSGGKISSHSGHFRQRKMLEKEDVTLQDKNKIDLDEYSWNPSKKEIRTLLRGLPKHVSIFLRKEKRV